jgi:Zn-dependent membrane protease YugP
MFFYDWTMIFVLPAVLLSLYAQWKLSSTFSHYSGLGTRSGLSGAEAAAALARRRQLGVSIQPVEGSLSDHYDPSSNVLRLSEPVYASRSIAAVGVAAHELGHALQKAEGYWPLNLRIGLVPLANFSSHAWGILFLLGWVAHIPGLFWAAAACFLGSLVFSLITLPVEFDASRRALLALREDGIITSAEEPGVRSVLSAAALTYVAAALMALLQLLRLVFIARQSED